MLSQFLALKNWILYFSFVLLAIGEAGCDEETGFEDEAQGLQSDAGTIEDPANEQFEELLSFMEDELEKNNVPGGAIAIVQDGAIKFSAGVGVKREGGTDPVNAETKFVIGSISKMLTAAGLMTLVDESRLNVDVPVTDYVPYFELMEPFDESSITTRKLLNHTAGLPDYADFGCGDDSNLLSDWFKSNTDKPVWTPPGKVWNYSNLGYSLAGLILEEIVGEPFSKVMKERIFTPLGMNGMTYDTKEAAAGNHAVGHSHDVNQQRVFVPIDAYSCTLSQPAGILFGDVLGMARFAQMQLAGGGEVLSAESVAKMQAPLVYTRTWTDNDYGFGIFSTKYKGLNIKWHGGAIGGYLTDWRIVPEKNFAVVVFLNADNYGPQTISLKALDIFFDLPLEDPPDHSTPRRTWAKYTGSYYQKYSINTGDAVLPPFTARVFLDEDNLLWIEFVGLGITAELTQKAEDNFTFEFQPGMQIPTTFWLNDQGTSQYFVTRFGVGERIKPTDEPADNARTE